MTERCRRCFATKQTSMSSKNCCRSCLMKKHKSLKANQIGSPPKNNYDRNHHPSCLLNCLCTHNPTTPSTAKPFKWFWRPCSIIMAGKAWPNALPSGVLQTSRVLNPASLFYAKRPGHAAKWRICTARRFDNKSLSTCS